MLFISNLCNFKICLYTFKVTIKARRRFLLAYGISGKVILHKGKQEVNLKCLKTVVKFSK